MRACVGENGTFTEKDASVLVRHMIKCVKEVHEHGVVHRCVYVRVSRC